MPEEESNETEGAEDKDKNKETEKKEEKKEEVKEEKKEEVKEENKDIPIKRKGTGEFLTLNVSKSLPSKTPLLKNKPRKPDGTKSSELISEQRSLKRKSTEVSDLSEPKPKRQKRDSQEYLNEIPPLTEVLTNDLPSSFKTILYHLIRVGNHLKELEVDVGVTARFAHVKNLNQMSDMQKKITDCESFITNVSKGFDSLMTLANQNKTDANSGAFNQIIITLKSILKNLEDLKQQLVSANQAIDSVGNKSQNTPENDVWTLGYQKAIDCQQLFEDTWKLTRTLIQQYQVTQ